MNTSCGLSRAKSRGFISLGLTLILIPSIAQATPPTVPPPDPCANPRQSFYTINTVGLPGGIEILENGGVDPEITVTSNQFLIVETWGYKYKFNNKEKYFFNNGWREGYGMLPFGVHMSNLGEVPHQDPTITTPGVIETPFSIEANYGEKDVVIYGELKQVIGESSCKGGLSTTSSNIQAGDPPSLWSLFWMWVTNLF